MPKEDSSAFLKYSCHLQGKSSHHVCFLSNDQLCATTPPYIFLAADLHQMFIFALKHPQAYQLMWNEFLELNPPVKAVLRGERGAASNKVGLIHCFIYYYIDIDR